MHTLPLVEMEPGLHPRQNHRCRVHTVHHHPGIALQEYSGQYSRGIARCAMRTLGFTVPLTGGEAMFTHQTTHLIVRQLQKSGGLFLAATMQ